ncbi:DUF1858 domain-containing protein [Candidatus Peribacteria bacterium]|nr:DUF1858 domain-containing protein [Candidatus Peribacteria bacterium]
MPRTRQSKDAAKSFRPRVDQDMNVMDVIALHPKAADILAAYGLHCFQCAFNTMDTLRSGAKSHGLSDVDVENLVVDIQELIDATPARTETLTLTKAAAKALQSIAKRERQKTACLRVTTDSSGGFCLEFTGKPMSSDRVFRCKGAGGVSLIASPDMLWRIGGSTVDFREGKFKLDVEEECGCVGKGCTCEESPNAS